MSRACTLKVAAAAGATIALAAGVSWGAPDPGPPVKPDPGPTVATTKVPVRAAKADRAPRVTETPPVAWPAPGPARLARSVPAGADVRVLDRAASAKAGVSGPLLQVNGGRTAKVPLEVDYSRFRHAFGGDWAARLRLVKIDADGPKPVRSRNDLKAATVSANVAGGETYALDAAPSGSTGDYRATSLSPSGSWQVSHQTGDFTWSEPVDAPAVPGAFEPSFALSYVSGSVDGRVASTNNQASWVGEGWDLGAGFIERRYKACGDDLAGGQVKTGDLCWETDNATLSLAGHSSELVRIAGTDTWRPVDDDGSRVERLSGAANDVRAGEHWRVTTTDGTQHYFGRHRVPGWDPGEPETSSTWTVPVFGNDVGEPCNGATFATSYCQQAWRWNLDYSVDPRGNSIVYYYAPETNAYGLNRGASKQQYTRGGVLLRAEYGSRHGENPTARVVFDTAERCLTATTCARTPAAMPDVPWDQNCETATCPGRESPTFWSTKRLATVTSEIRRSSGWTPVDQSVLNHSFPATGDGSTPALWLDSVTHTGLAGGSAASPPVRFLPSPFNNRVDTTTDGLSPMPKFRITTVRNPSGGEVNVVYDRDCQPGALPAPHANTTRCFPIRWTPDGASARDDWFAKYAVARITEKDLVGASPLSVTNYDYLGAAGWRYNDDKLIPPEQRTWSHFRGYEKVRVRRGDPSVAGAARSSTVYHYHRGMHGDHLPGGATRTATVTDSRGTVVEDSDPLAGFVREQITYDGVRSDGSDGPEVNGAIHDAYQRHTGTYGSLQSYQIDVARTRSRETVPGGQRSTQTEYTYNDDGLVTAVNDLGDQSTTDDDRCTRTEYARDTTAWRLDLPSREHSVGVACSQTPAYPRDAISDVRTFYDGQALGQPPTTGAQIRTEQLDSFDGSAPHYVTTSRTNLDAYGRVVASEDALGRRTSTSFSPDTGQPASSTVTDAKGYRSTTTFDAWRGQAVSVLDVDNNRKTELTYDPAGRLIAVWRPGRRKDIDGPNVRYRYLLRDNGSSWVATENLTPNASYVTSYALFDGFLRARQTQAPGSGGGRVFTATEYDSRGLAVKSTGPEHTTGTAAGDLIAVPDAQAFRQTLTSYDGAERPTVQAYHSLAVEQWRSTVEHHGDGASVTPPPGGTAERTYTDARGRVVRRLQYLGATPSGSHETTAYGYDDNAQLTSVTDPMGNVWRYEYDLLGRKVKSIDPDAGTSEYAYDAAGQLQSVTDGRGRKLAYAYDELGRKTQLHRGTLAGDKLAAWTYDTLPGGKGLPSGSVRYADGGEYAVQVTGYETATGQPTGTRVVIPASENGLSGTYTTTYAYRPDGSPGSTTLPQLGNLASETLNHSYDSLGLPAGLSSSLANYVTDTQYSWFGQRTQLTMGDLGTEAWNTRFYDNATGRLARAYTERRLDDSTVNDTTYRYDDAGNVTRISDQFTGTAAEDQCFRYDHGPRLTEAWTSTAGCAGAPGTTLGGPAPYWASWSYDAAGNRTSERQHSPAGNTTRTYTYPAAGSRQPHTVRSLTTSSPSGTRTDTFAYDASGDTTSLRGQTLEWDDERHLASIGSSRFVYDADGNRLIRRDAAGKTLFLSSGEVRSTDTSTTQSGTRYYQHGGESVAVRTSGGLQYLTADHHQTDEIRIDARTLTAAKRRTDPFGNPRGAQPPWPGSHGFVGGIIDPDGLTHLGAREYDPTIGRFISADPIIDVNDPQQINGYAYANNNPTTLSDPDGLIATRCPDGECRFGGYKTNRSPAARFNVQRKIYNNRGTRCPDGARSCRAVREFQPAKPQRQRAAEPPGGRVKVPDPGWDSLQRRLLGPRYITPEEAMDRWDQEMGGGGQLFRAGARALGVVPKPKYPATRLVPGGGLKAHEATELAELGHTLAKHVGQSPDDLALRLRTDPKITAASTFADRATAEDAISAALTVHYHSVKYWLDHPHPQHKKFAFEQEFDRPIGQTLARHAAAPEDVSAVRIVLVRDSSELGYYILTAFPVP